MKTLFCCLAVVLSVGATTQLLADKKDPAKKEIKYRQSAFKMISYHFGPMGAMVKGEIPFDAAVAKKNAEAFAALSHLPINGFKEKSVSDKSRAKAKIWEDWADFESKMSDLSTAADNLSTKTASIDEFKPAFLTAAKTCKACHKTYRKKKKK